MRIIHDLTLLWTKRGTLFDLSKRGTLFDLSNVCTILPDKAGMKTEHTKRTPCIESLSRSLNAAPLTIYSLQV